MSSKIFDFSVSSFRKKYSNIQDVSKKIGQNFSLVFRFEKASLEGLTMKNKSFLPIPISIFYCLKICLVKTINLIH